MGRLVGPDAEKLKDSKLVMWFIGVVRVLDVEMELVWRMRAALFNVETRASPASGGRIWMPAGSRLRLVVPMVRQGLFTLYKRVSLYPPREPRMRRHGRDWSVGHRAR